MTQNIYKARFVSKCNYLGIDLIENFIAGSKYKEVWHERTNYLN